MKPLLIDVFGSKDKVNNAAPQNTDTNTDIHTQTQTTTAEHTHTNANTHTHTSTCTQNKVLYLNRLIPLPVMNSIFTICGFQSNL